MSRILRDPWNIPTEKLGRMNVREFEEGCAIGGNLPKRETGCRIIFPTNGANGYPTPDG